MTFVISLGRNSTGSCGAKSDAVKGVRVNELVAGCGWNTFLRWSAKTLALSVPLRDQFPVELRRGTTVSVGACRFLWSFHNEFIVTVGVRFSMYLSCASASSFLSALVSLREVAVNLLFAPGDLCSCHSLRLAAQARTCWVLSLHKHWRYATLRDSPYRNVQLPNTRI